MLNELAIGTALIVIAVIFHVAGLAYLVNLLKRVDIPIHRWGQKVVNSVVMGIAVLVIVGLHTVEAWGWAVVYLIVGEFDNLRQALYFSVVTSTTLGYGDITLSEKWQLLGTFEAMGGLILFGASTAFLLAVMRHLLKESGFD